MPKLPIPPREPIGDPFVGVVVEAGGRSVLVSAEMDNSAAELSAYVVRYGIRYLGKPHLSIVPGLVAVDYGQMFNGEAGWDFLLKRSNLYPRAEVFGYRNDGRDEMMYVKNLDLALPLEALVYSSAEASQPITRIDALIVTEAVRATLSPRLRDYLAQYRTLAEWQAETVT